MTKEQAIEQLKDLKAVYSGAVQAGEISIANMIKGGIDLIEKLQKENKELKNNTRKNENELEFDVNCDWIALQKMLDGSEKSNEYISYKNEKWIKEKYCIPIQRIKDIIDRIDYDIKKTKEIISKNTNIYASYRKNDYQIVRLKAMNTKSLDIKKRLQELLDGSDTDVGSIESEE